MNVARIVRMAVLVAVASVAIAVLGHELFYLPWLRSIVARGEASLQDTSAEELNREIRATLAPGASRVEVESLLRSRQVQYSYRSAEEIDAVASDLKGSTSSAPKGLLVQFHFDDHDALRRIDSQVVRTAH